MRSPCFRALAHAAAALALATVGATGPARAVGIGPSITVLVDGLPVHSMDCLTGLVCDPIKGTATLPVPVNVSLTGEYLITLLATDVFGPGTGIRLEPDPEIFYGASVIDFGSPSTFGFIFQQGIVPTTTPGSASHDHSSSTSDGSVANGVPVTAAAPPAGIATDGGAAEIAVYSLSTNGGASWLNAGLDLGPSFVGPAGTSGTQGPFAEGGAGPAGSGAYDAMRVDVNFSMGGGNDSYTFNGRAEIVPEPETGLLLLIGLGILSRHARSAR